MKPLSLLLARKRRWAAALAKEVSLELVIDEKIEQPHTTKDAIFMPLYDITWEDGSEKDLIWCGILWHEIGHRKFMGDLELLIELNLPKEAVSGFIFNRVADHNSDKLQYGEYPGRDMYADACVNARYKNFKGGNPTGRLLTPDIQTLVYKITALNYLDCVVRSTWQKKIYLSHIPYILTDEEIHYYNILCDYPMFIEEYNNIRNPGTENWEFTHKIMDILEITDDKQNDRPGNSGQTKGITQNKIQHNVHAGQAGTGRSDSITGAPDGKTGRGCEGYSSRMQKSIRRDDRDIVVPYELLAGTNNSLNPFPYHQDQMDGRKRYRIDYSNAQRHGIQNFVLAPFIEWKHNPLPSNSYITPHVKKLTQNKLNTNLINELKIRSRRKWLHGTSAGKLNKKQIASVATGVSTRIFKKKIHTTILDTAIIELIDHSGSMRGDAFIHACASGILLNDCFTTLGIPVEILGFTSSGDKGLYFIHKEFHKFKNKHEIINSFGHAEQNASANPDGEAILWAVDRLLIRKEKRKILLVLSDGSPAFTNPTGDTASFTAHVIKSIEQSGVIEIYGIGIMDDNVKRFYKNNIVIDKTQELENQILNLLRNTIIK